MNDGAPMHVDGQYTSNDPEGREPCPAPDGYRWVWCVAGEYCWFELPVRADEDDEMFSVGARRMMVPLTADEREKLIGEGQ